MNLEADMALTDAKESIIENIVIFSRLDEKLDRLSAGLVGNIKNARNSMAEEIFNKYKEIVVSFFDPSELKENIRSIMVEHYDDRTCKEVLGFLEQPQIELMNQKEESAKTAEAMNEMQGFFAGLQASPPSEGRKRLIEQADRIKRVSSIVINTQVELFQAITWGMRSLNTDEQKITESQLEQMALDMKAQLTPHIEQQVWMGALYAYKDVSDSELEEYISLHETAEGQLTTEFTQSVYSSVHKQVLNRLQSALEAEFS